MGPQKADYSSYYYSFPSHSATEITNLRGFVEREYMIAIFPVVLLFFLSTTTPLPLTKFLENVPKLYAG